MSDQQLANSGRDLGDHKLDKEKREERVGKTRRSVEKKRQKRLMGDRLSQQAIVR